ncbi:MAG TPA: hypothetical protein VHY33_09945, partial [Thermoanaerobaculia bacterium]|nr:hypothetical protein [Thermoanaerobaculia bacterium]
MAAAALGFAVAIAVAIRTIPADPLTLLGHRPRVVVGRVSVFEYAGFRVLRSGETVANQRAYRALEELEKTLVENRTGENLRRLADARLAVGEARTALPLLEEATRIHPDDAVALSDLAAAELAMGHIADAAEHAARALDIDTHEQSATFNLALSLEQLANRPAAIEAWRKYLDLDAKSGWAAEAQRHLSALLAPRASYEKDRDLLSGGVPRAAIERVTRQYPQRARARSHNVLLEEWVETGSADVLDALRTIAAIRASEGDPYLRDMVDHAAAHRTDIAQGVRMYADARISEKAGDWDVASSRFAEAARLLQRAGSPLAIGSEIYSASSAMSAGHNENALNKAVVIEERLAATGDRYPAVAAEAAWIRGLIQARAGATNEALDAYRKALDEARRSGEVELEASIAELVASRQAAVGELEDADRLRLQVLQRLDQIAAEPIRMYVAYQEMAFISLRASRPHVSLAFAKAASQLAEESGDASQLAESTERRALALRELGRQDEAIAAIASARVHAMGIIAQGARDRILSEIDYTTGRIEMPRRPDRAIAAYGSALEIWNRYGWRNHTASGLLARAQASLAAGDKVGAERDFLAGIEEIERQRSQIDEPLLRIAYFERSDSLFDQLITLLVNDGRTEEALSIVERKRSRFLLDQLAGGTPTATPLNASEIVRRVGKTAAIVEFALLDRAAVAWLIFDGRIVQGRTAASRNAIETVAAQHLQAL